MTQFNVGDRVKYFDSSQTHVIEALGHSIAVLSSIDGGREHAVPISLLRLIPLTVTVTIPAELGEKAKENYPHGREPSGFLADMIGQAVADSLRQQEKGPTP